MANSAAYPKDSLAGPTPTLPVASEIQAQLKHILASPSFQGSKRGQQFLEYVCLKALSGEMGCLKERSIAVEVFGRQPNSDMGDDTIVPIGAREVRKRLAQYYVSAGQPPRDWNISSKEDGSAAEDYFLVCRVKTPIAGGAQFVVAGVKQFGTEAAGRLVADLEQLGAILRTLPQGWENQNLQLVLHSRVISNTPAQPEVVAWHVW